MLLSYSTVNKYTKIMVSSLQWYFETYKKEPKIQLILWLSFRGFKSWCDLILLQSHMNLPFSRLTVYGSKFCGNISHLCSLITPSVETQTMGIILSLIPPSASDSVTLSESTLCFANHWCSPLSLAPCLH